MRCFAVTAPGLEATAVEELRELGIASVAEPGGVAWDATHGELYAANLESRTATRVLVRVAEFRARTFFELERHARRLPWDRFVAEGRAVALRVTCRKSRLYHEGAVAQRVHEAIQHRAGTSPMVRDGTDESEGEDAQLFVVRFVRDVCTVSVDASGAPLHRRGYRLAVGRAPLRETLAAAMLRGSGWAADTPLLDPMCGSGTLPIEAALVARGIAPGLALGGEPRQFAFQQWQEFDEREWSRVVDRARQKMRPAASAPILGSDRDAGGVAAARANAERAGVAQDIEFSVAPLSAVEPPDRPGCIIVNPPYGVRVGDSQALRNLYAGLGNLARRRLGGWTLAMLAADPMLEAQVGVDFRELWRSNNGGIPVRLLVGRVEAP